MRSDTLCRSIERERPPPKTLSLALAVAFCLSAPSPALAQEKPATSTAGAPSTVTLTTLEGRVVGLENGKHVIDLGAKVGLQKGAVAELWRPLKLRNPATGKVVEDRYRIGTLRVVEVLEIASFADADPDLRHAVAPGDIVITRVARAPDKTAAPPSTTVQATASLVVVEDADGKAVTSLIEALRGLTPEERVRAMRTWLKKNAKNRFAEAVADDARVLLHLSAERDELRAAGPMRDVQSEEPAAAHFDAPRSGLAGQSLEFGIETSGDVRGVVLHARHSREVAYVTTAFHEAGRNFWVATLPSDRVLAPQIEYFIEAVRSNGTPVSIIGTDVLPFRVDTPDTPLPAPPLKHRSTASLYSDYADYNRFRGNDYLWQVEGFFGMRFADRGVRAVRTGFGVYRGFGGSVQELDVDGAQPRAVGLTYGHLEGEFGFSHTTSFIGRAAVGLGEAGVTGGAQVHLRIGNDLETNLMIGGEVLGGIGLRGIAQLELLPQGRFPLMVRTEVTNQPAGIAPAAQPSPIPGAPATPLAQDVSDVGGRVVLQAGYRVAAPLVLFVRGSAQGRTINHAGLGFGGGVTYQW